MPRNTANAGTNYVNTDLLKLYETGELADGTIVCSDRTWKVHRVILASRSEWFKLAFLGPFKEGQTSEVKLHKEEPHIVDWTLRHIYGEDTTEVLLEKEDLPTLCVELVRIADFLQLGSLKEAVIQALITYLDLKVILASTSATIAPLILSELFDGMKLSYTHDIDCMDPLRGCFLSFLWVMRHKVLDFPQTNDMLVGCRQMNRDLLYTLAFGKCARTSPWLQSIKNIGTEKIEQCIHRGHSSEGISLIQCSSCRCVLHRDGGMLKHLRFTIPLPCHSSQSGKIMAIGMTTWCRKCAIGFIDRNEFPWR